MKMKGRMRSLCILILFACLECCYADSTNPYEILGLNRMRSSADEIKKAYRRLSLRYHPDKNKAKDAPDKFAAVMAAYELLTDANAKYMFDVYGQNERLNRMERERAARVLREEQLRDPYDKAAIARVSTRLDRDLWAQAVANSTVPWLVAFHRPHSCSACGALVKEWERAATSMEGSELRFGTVHCEAHRPFCERMRVARLPAVMLVVPGDDEAQA